MVSVSDRLSVPEGDDVTDISRRVTAGDYIIFYEEKECKGK